MGPYKLELYWLVNLSQCVLGKEIRIGKAIEPPTDTSLKSIFCLIINTNNFFFVSNFLCDWHILVPENTIVDWFF